MEASFGTPRVLLAVHSVLFWAFFSYVYYYRDEAVLWHQAEPHATVALPTFGQPAKPDPVGVTRKPDPASPTGKPDPAAVVPELAMEAEPATVPEACDLLWSWDLVRKPDQCGRMEFVFEKRDITTESYMQNSGCTILCLGSSTGVLSNIWGV